MADLCSAGLILTSRMLLALIIERFMTLKRQESAMFSRFDLLERVTLPPTDDYGKLFKGWKHYFRLLYGARRDTIYQSNLTAMAYYEVNLAFIDQEMARKLREMRFECT